MYLLFPLLEMVDSHVHFLNATKKLIQDFSKHMNRYIRSSHTFSYYFTSQAWDLVTL